MMFLLANSTIICFPTYIIHDHKFLTYPYCLFLLIECFFDVIAAFYVFKCIILCISVRTFHKNFSILIVTYGIQWFEVVFANFLIKPYEIGYWTIGSNTGIIKQFYADDTGAVRINDATNHFWFFLGGFCKWHFAISVVSFFLGISIERTFACYFLNDYEKKSRVYLAVLINLVCQAQSLILAYMLFFNITRMPILFVITALPNVIGVVLFLYTRSFNTMVTKTIENFSNPQNYTLAARFQAKENIRCLQMIYKTVIVGLINMTVSTVVVAVLMLELFPNIDFLFNIIFQGMFSNVGPLVICITIIQSVDSWRKFKFTDLEVFRRFSKNRQKTVKINVTEAGKEKTVRMETDTYFNQLKFSWE